MSYTTIKLPFDFVQKYIDPILEQKGSGFTSRSDVIKNAVREYSQNANKKTEVKN